jgi:hypothetical protein
MVELWRCPFFLQGSWGLVLGSHYSWSCLRSLLHGSLPGVRYGVNAAMARERSLGSAT